MLSYVYLLQGTVYEMSALLLKGAKVTFLDNPYKKHFRTLCSPVHSPFTALVLQHQTCSCFSYFVSAAVGSVYAECLRIAPSDGCDSSASD